MRTWGSSRRDSTMMDHKDPSGSQTVTIRTSLHLFPRGSRKCILDTLLFSWEWRKWSPNNTKNILKFRRPLRESQSYSPSFQMIPLVPVLHTHKDRQAVLRGSDHCVTLVVSQFRALQELI